MTERKCFVFNFADIEVREREFLLIKGGERLSVEPKAFRVLLFLLRNPGRLSTKDEIVASVWNDSAVSDNSLTRSIAQLRRVLDDDSREPRYILTVPTLGYRFLCEVKVRDDGFSSPDAASPVTPTGSAEDKKPFAARTQNRRSRWILFASAAALVLLLIGAGFILRRLTGTGTVPAPGLQPIAIEQRLTSNPPDVPVRDAVISPDGKYAAYADPTGLYLKQISNGESRPWSLPKGFVARPSSWFPDGTHLLVVRIGGQPQYFNLWKPSLYKLSILGGEPQKIMNDAGAGYVSPDGSHIAYLPTENFSEMWVMDSDGANPRRVVSSGEPSKPNSYSPWIHPVAWSPSGQHLAYVENHVAGPEPAEPTRTLRITDPSGAFQTVVLDDSRIGEALWWTPDGRILFPFREDSASGGPNYGVYSIRVNERTLKAEGLPRPITQAEGTIRAMSGTADGKRLVVSRSNNAPAQAFIATYDAGAHKWNEPRRLTFDANSNLAEAWTSDSKAVFFVSDRNGTWKLFKQAIDQTTPEVLAEGRNISVPRLSADGSQVLYLSSSHPDYVSFPASLMSRPIAGGTPRMVLQGKGIVNHQCAMAPSTRCIFSQVDGPTLIFRLFDLEHGAGRELLRVVGSLNWSLSSDGSKLAIFLDEHRIRFLSLETGAAHDVTVKDWPLSNGDWATNGRAVFMPSDTPQGVPVILEVDQSGKATVVLQGKANNEFGWLIQSPDGRNAVLSEYIPSGNNAWIVDYF